MNKTKIEYLDYTYNPIKMRCTPISDGCRNCWAIAMAKRLAKNPSIYRDQQKAYAGGPPMLDHKEIEAPLHLKKSAKIGVQFMGDILHDSIDGFWISAIWGVMQRCPQHTFFILTKRPERFLKLTPQLPVLENVWFGVSISTNEGFWMIEKLLQISAAHRWVSIEPMLGTINLRGWIEYSESCVNCGDGSGSISGRCCDEPMLIENPSLDWVVLGGETGPKARPMHPDWVRSVKDQCKAAGVPFFFKHHGEWLHQSQFPIGASFRKLPNKNYIGCELITRDSIIPKNALVNEWPDDTVSIHVGHKAAGRLLDGREYSEMP